MLEMSPFIVGFWLLPVIVQIVLPLGVLVVHSTVSLTRMLTV